MSEQPMSARERQVAELASRKPPLKNAEIAEHLGISVYSVKCYLKRLRAKGQVVASRRGRTREPDWWEDALPMIRSYRAENVSWRKMGRLMGREPMTLRHLYLRGNRND
jgi:DNA-binding CsgD family transcriptional regulator